MKNRLKLLLITSIITSSIYSQDLNSINFAVNGGVSSQGLGYEFNIEKKIVNNFYLRGTIANMVAYRTYNLNSGGELRNKFKTLTSDISLIARLKKFKFGLGYSIANETLERNNFIVNGNQINLDNKKGMNGVNFKSSIILKKGKLIDFELNSNFYFFDKSNYARYNLLIGFGFALKK